MSAVLICKWTLSHYDDDDDDDDDMMTLSDNIARQPVSGKSDTRIQGKPISLAVSQSVRRLVN